MINLAVIVIVSFVVGAVIWVARMREGIIPPRGMP